MAASGTSLELQELQEYFAGRLPDRLREIDEAWSRVRASAWSPEALRELHRLVHSLSGAGATFGFPEVTRTSRILERFLKNALEGPGPEWEGESVRVVELLAEIRRASLSSSSPNPSSAPPPPARPEPEPARSGERILLVEDDADLASSLASQLRHYGYDVRTLPGLDGPAALAAELERERPDVLIADVTFPDGRLAGAAAIAEVRRSRAPGDAPRVVFLSPRGDLEARLEAVRAGGDAYFAKPVDVGSLVEKLDLLTEHKGGLPYRVLIVEDDPDLAAQYAGILQGAGMQAEVLSDALRIMDVLYSFSPDLLLMDVYLKGCTGPELAAVLRQQESYRSTPIIFLSSEGGLTEQIAAIDLGGDEFLTKPIEPRHLVSAVAARSRRGRILQSLISHDGLTGLLNHGNLKLQLEAEISRASRDGSSVAYAMIDLDRFKAINDEHGHSAGDRLLRSLALFLRQRLRRSDILGRYGGDEMAVILPRTDAAAAARVLDEIREKFAHLRHRFGNQEVVATLSCGVAAYPDRANAELLAEAADSALYAAKRSGRNRVELAI